MARSPGRAKAGATKAGDAPHDMRETLLDAFLALLAERPFETIGLNDVAGRAGVSLAELRGAYGSTFDLLAGFVKETDRKVLMVDTDDMDDQPARERLFDVLMRRLDVLAPHKAAVRSLTRSVRSNPGLALGMNRLARRSQQWMMAAAGIDTAGIKGFVRAQGLVLLFGKVLRVWLDDEDPGLARTMAALDRELSNGERALGLLNNVCRVATCGRRSRRARQEEAEPDAPIAA